MVRTLLPGLIASLLPGLGCAAEIGSSSTYAAHDEAERTVSIVDVDDEWASDGDWLVSPVLEAPEGATRVGMLLGLHEAGPFPQLEARPVFADGASGAWVPLETTWSEMDYHVAVADLGGMATGAQIRTPREALPHIRTLQWNAVVPDEPVEPVADGESVGGASEALRSELSGLGIVTRSAWGARATRCTSRNGHMNRMAIHYTVTPSENPERQVRGIQRYHMDSRGWCDVGYHFLVGIDGTVYEGRPLHLVGAHVGGHNTNNIGISFVGCFNPSGCPSSYGPKHPPEVMLRAGGNLVGELSRLFGITVNTSNVKGHRDHSGASTSCPGQYLYERLDTIRSIARSGGGGGGSDPAPAPDPGGGSCTHSYGGTYSDTACSAGYQCCDGRWRTRGACGSCACVEETGETGCTGTSSPTPDPAPTGESCAHTYGGTYGDRACSTSYQCCDGDWKTRGACGSCTCVEGSGETGCGATSSSPPAGASCTHTYGGSYANTACSAGYQCCNGDWKTRGACGGCFCVEETGETGCGT